MGEGHFDYEVSAKVKLIVTADTPSEAEERAQLDLGDVCSDIEILDVK